MKNTPDTTIRERTVRRGAPLLYDEKTISTTWSLPPAIKQAVVREKNRLNIMHDTSEYSESRVASGILAKYFGIELSNNGS